MASKRDLRSYFVKTNNTNRKSSQKVFPIIQSFSNNIVEMEIQHVQQKIKKQVANPGKLDDNIPSKIKQEIGSYTLIHGTKVTIYLFRKVYTKHSPKRATVNGWKERCKRNYLHSIGKRGRLNLVIIVIIEDLGYNTKL